jgi:hypothetical protein
LVRTFGARDLDAEFACDIILFRGYSANPQSATHHGRYDLARGLPHAPRRERRRAQAECQWFRFRMRETLRMLRRTDIEQQEFS